MQLWDPGDPKEYTLPSSTGGGESAARWPRQSRKLSPSQGTKWWCSVLANRSARGRWRTRLASRGRAGPRWAQPGPGAPAPEQVQPGLRCGGPHRQPRASEAQSGTSKLRLQLGEVGRERGAGYARLWPGHSSFIHSSAKTRAHFPSGLSDSFEGLPWRGDGRGFSRPQFSRKDAVLGWGAHLPCPSGSGEWSLQAPTRHVPREPGKGHCARHGPGVWGWNRPQERPKWGQMWWQASWILNRLRWLDSIKKFTKKQNRDQRRK